MSSESIAMAKQAYEAASLLQSMRRASIDLMMPTTNIHLTPWFAAVTLLR